MLLTDLLTFVKLQNVWKTAWKIHVFSPVLLCMRITVWCRISAQCYNCNTSWILKLTAASSHASICSSSNSLCDTCPHFHYHFIIFKVVFFAVSASHKHSPSAHTHTHTVHITGVFLAYANSSLFTLVCGDIKEQLLPGLKEQEEQIPYCSREHTHTHTFYKD